MGVTDYANQSNVAALGVTFQPKPAFTLSLQGSMIMSTAEFDPVIMPDAPEEVLEAIEAADYDYSMINEYSNLDYEQLDLSLNGSYQFSPRLRLDAGITYLDLTDNAGYVYGVESGSLWIVRAGIEILGL
jgi:hypothetical protein